MLNAVTALSMLVVRGRSSSFGVRSYFVADIVERGEGWTEEFAGHFDYRNRFHTIRLPTGAGCYFERG